MITHTDCTIIVSYNISHERWQFADNQAKEYLIWGPIGSLSVLAPRIFNNELWSSYGHWLGFWPTVLSVEPLVHCVVCLSVVCDILYCGKTVHPSKKLSEGMNRKLGSKSLFLGRRHISTSGFASTATETVVFALFCPYSPAIGTRWYK